MNIPDNAYEAAYYATKDYVVHAGGISQTDALAIADKVLEAAAPFIAAQALRDKAYDMTDPRDSDELLESADEIDGHL